MYIIKKWKKCIKDQNISTKFMLFQEIYRTKKKWTMFKIVCRLFFFNTVIYKLDKMGIDYS